MPEAITADKLWQFSLQLYPQVKPLCLQWQNEQGANVNLLLLLCYLEQQQLSLTAAELQQLATTLDAFNAQFTRPLRALRQNSAAAPLSAVQQQTLKQALLQAELELEKLEQQLLLQHCPPLSKKATPLLELYLAQLNTTSNTDSDTLAALTALAALPPEQRPEVVYLDPMFPHRDKSALVKKDMRVFRSVVGEDLDADALLAPARAVATKRVVVKRPRLAPDLAGVEPQQRMTGQSNRFDLYAPQALPQGASPSRQGGA